MTDLALLQRLAIEPLGRQHDRAAFSCGVASIENFLKHSATRQQDQNVTRVFVIVEPPAKTVLGFYALNAHEIDATAIPEAQRRKLPGYPKFGAVYLSMIATTTVLQGKGIGSFLLADALKRCVAVSEQTGVMAIVLDALNDDAARLYRRLGFVAIPSEQHSRRIVIDMKTVRAAVISAVGPETTKTYKDTK